MADHKYRRIGSVEDRVIEECSELMKAICKAKRFGLDDFHPDRPGSSNRGEILFEIKDVRRVIDELERKLQ